MKVLLVLFCAVTYHYCYGYPVFGGGRTEGVQIGDDPFLKYMLETWNDTYLKDYFNQLLSNPQDLESLVNDISQQDIDTNEIGNLDSDLEPLVFDISQQDIDTNEIGNIDSDLESAVNDSLSQQDIHTNEIGNLDSELESLVNLISQQDIDTNDIGNLDSELESLVNDIINQQDIDTHEIGNLDSDLEPLVFDISQQGIDTNEIGNPDSELGSLVNDINEQDLKINEISNLDLELGNINDNDVVVVHFKYDVNSGTIAVDSIKVEEAPELTAFDTLPWFFLALGVALLMTLVWYFYRKEKQYKRDNEWRFQLGSEK